MNENNTTVALTNQDSNSTGIVKVAINRITKKDVSVEGLDFTFHACENGNGLVEFLKSLNIDPAGVVDAIADNIRAESELTRARAENLRNYGCEHPIVSKADERRSKKSKK